MQRFFVFASLICLLAWPAAGLSTAADLSDNLPAAVQQLPTFGTVAWTVSDVPYVADGPNGGISGMGMVEYDGKIYLMGGFIPAGDETTDPGRRTSRWLHRYDPQLGTRTRLDDMPGRREYCRATVAGDTIFLVGGGEQTPDQTPSHQVHGDVFSFNLQQQSWQNSLPSLSVPRTHTSVGHVGSLLVVAGGNQYDFAEGGYSPNTIQGVVEVIDLDQPEQGWSQKTSIPGDKRGWSATAVVNDKLYMLGGLTFEASGMRKLQKTLSYEPGEDRWTELAPPPLAISGWEGSVFQDRYILAAGGVAEVDGQSESTWNDMMFVYDTQSDSWLKFDNPLPPGGVFNDPGVCIIGDTIYVAGAEGPDGTHYNHLLIGKITHVPEPGMIGLLGTAAAGLSLYGWRKWR